MRSSILRSIFARPAYKTTITDETWREASAFRLFVLAACVVGDVAFVLLARSVPALDAAMTASIFSVVIAVTSIDLAITAAMFTGRLRNRRMLPVIVVLEMLGTIVAIQATGSINNALILLGLGAVVLYRFYFGWKIARLAAATLVIAHTAVIALEMGGVIEPAVVVIGPKVPAYSSTGLMIFNLGIIAIAYALAFFGTNTVVNLIRSKERALAEMRAEMARLADGLQGGRLTGMSLADRYALGELLGRGGMGEIYVAHDVVSGDKVAVKVLHQSLVCDMEMLQRFRREADLASRLPGSCTAAVHGVGVDYERDLHFIILDYLRGEDLGAYLRRRERLSPAEVIALGEQLARVLDAAHDAGIVHRDLKPQNVFLLGGDDRAGYDVRLLDFGIAKLAENQSGPTLTQRALILGTPGYMAPEQARGDTRNAGCDADRFALAAILFRALTGVTPFGDRTALEYVREVVDCEPRSTGDAGVDAVFARGLAKQPGDRFPCARSLLDALAAALAGTLSRRVA